PRLFPYTTLFRSFALTTQTTQELDTFTIERVKETVPVLQERGAEITKRFYQLMLTERPELNNLFNQTHQRTGDQSKALAATVYAAAANIDNLENIMPVVKQVAHKHRSLNIKPHHYPIVGKYLLMAMQDVLGTALSDETLAAWKHAYDAIADVFIGVEKQLYDEVLAKEGGWIDFRDFKVVKKVPESDVITSFYLDAVDGKPFPHHQPGQFITVKADIPGEKYKHLRQYTLSCAPGERYYRISVKREDALNGKPAGVVSNYLHKQVEEGSILPISAPGGDFILDDKDERPLVLISGGVGITPMMSMLEAVIKSQPQREVIFIHAAKSGNVHAMKDRVDEIAKNHSQVSAYTIYENPRTEDEGVYDKKGYIDEA